MNELQLQARSRNRVSSRHKAINRHVCNTRKSIFSRRRQLIASDTQHLTRVTHHHTHAQLNGVSGNGRSKENFVQVTGSVYIYQPLNMIQAFIRYFMSGACREGESCRFSHEWKSRPEMVCRYYLQGACVYGRQCRYDHSRPREADTSAPKSKR